MGSSWAPLGKLLSKWLFHDHPVLAGSLFLLFLIGLGVAVARVEPRRRRKLAATPLRPPPPPTRR